MLTAPMLPYVLLAAVSATSLAGISGYVKGRIDGRAAEAAHQVMDQKLVADVAAAAQAAAAHAIAGIRSTQTIIRQNVETQVREIPVYGDCQHTQRVFDDVNAALAPAIATAGGQLPPTDAAVRPELRGHHAQADRRGRPIPPVPGRSAGRERRP